MKAIEITFTPNLQLYPYVVYGNSGEIRLFSYDDFMHGTLYGYRLRRYERCADQCSLYTVQDNFSSKADACAHGLSRLGQ